MKIDFSNTPEQNKTQVFSSLEDCFATNVITVDEYEQRLERVIAAVDNVAIAAVAADLPTPIVRKQSSPTADREQHNDNRPASERTYRSTWHDQNQKDDAGTPWRGKESSSIFSIFSGASRKGRWQVPRILFLFSLFGGNDIDLSDAVFSDGDVQIVNFSIFGGNTLYLNGCRRDLPKMNITSFSLFGGTEFRAKKAEYLPVNGIHVEAMAIFGGFDVQVPDSAGVRSSGAGIFGGAPNIDIAPVSSIDGYIDIKTFALFGGVSVKNASGKNL